MDINYSQVPELLKIFRGYFPGRMHINYKWTTVLVDDKALPVINVKINDTSKGGEGEENWTLDYANTILQSPKEMELCVKRWLDSFAKAKRKPTLDLPGYFNPTLN